MIDQTLVRSGFDIELLLSETYIKYFLLISFETGSTPWWGKDRNPTTGRTTYFLVHPPEELRTNRLYEPRADFVPHPFLDQFTDYTQKDQACNVTLLPDDQGADIRVDLIVSVYQPPAIPGGNPLALPEVPMTMDSRFFVSADTDANGFQRNVRLNLELVDIGGVLVETADHLPPEYGWNKAATLANMKKQFDRSIPLLVVGEGGAIHQIETQKFFAGDDGHPTALGIYVNLKLKSGPEPDAFVGPRGDLALAQNFLPAGHHLAFGFSSNLYPRLGTDIFHRMAEPKPGGGYHYPVMDDGAEKGHLLQASVYPAPPGPDHTTYPNVLVIDVEGEYYLDNLPNPNFHMMVRLIPVIQDGVLTFKTDFDLDIPAFAWLLVATTLLSFLSFKAALPLTLLVLAFKAAVEKLGEDRAVPIIESRLDDASVLDAFPNKLTIEQRRWDPTYFTNHQVVSLVKGVAINNRGVAFSAYDLRVGKEPKPLEDAVIRSEVRDAAGTVSGLLYRVSDWPAFKALLGPVYPAIDQMDYVETVDRDGGVEAARVHLTLEQAIERIKAGRLLEAIPYSPYKVDEREHQIYQILALSKREGPEIHALAERLLRQELQAAHGQEYRARARQELLAELGREPTTEELQTRFNAILDVAVSTALPKRYRRERERFLKFDLEPFEFADLQQRKILFLEYYDLQIIKMRASAGGTVYYRDKPDQEKGDNLLKLPHYKSKKIVRA